MSMYVLMLINTCYLVRMVISNYYDCMTIRAVIWTFGPKCNSVEVGYIMVFY